MESTQFDEFDAEVWSFFCDEDVKEFTSSPPQTGLIRPVPVRLEPPFPWDCGIEFDAGRILQTEPKRISAFIPVSRPADSAARVTSPSEEIQPTPMNVKDVRPNMQGPLHCNIDPVEAEVSDLLQRLTTTQAELDCVRDDLKDARLSAQCLELKNKHLKTKLHLMKTEKAILQQNADDIKKETEWLKAELKIMQDARRNDGEQDEGTDTRQFPQTSVASTCSCKKIPVSHDNKFHVDGKNVCLTDMTTFKDNVDPKNLKKKSVLKQLRKAIKKITR
ncbi:uncharacterized protein [Haliotis asinina]|uniref:uncharacterized protein n=1 Tax=Haliotis asinina TaxID=109174 RepID=UPI003531E581